MEIDLEKKHKLYTENIQNWRFYRAAFDGPDALIAEGYLYKHQFESDTNYLRRKKEATGFNYSAGVINLVTQFLAQTDIKKELGALAADPVWEAFAADCDQFGANLSDFLNDCAAMASVYGHIGLCVTKPEDDYPYLAMFSPENILDWKYERNDAGRQELTYIKLYDNEGFYYIWTKTGYDVFAKKDGGEPERVQHGQNPLDEIPFIWFRSRRSMKVPYFGTSDIANIAYIDASILRNVSQGEEIIYKSAFPILLHPWEREDAPGNIDKEGDIQIGLNNVLGFDPALPGSKPDWLRSESNEPIDALLAWIDRKVKEIYRTMNLSGLQASSESMSARSADAMEQEFQMLNAALVLKGKNAAEALRSVIYFWQRWQFGSVRHQDFVIEPPLKYNVVGLMKAVEEMTGALSLVPSVLFKHAIAKKVARGALPELSDKELQEIYDDIGNTNKNIGGMYVEEK